MTPEDKPIHWVDVLRGAALISDARLLIWAVYLLLPLNVFQQVPIYKYCDDLAPEWVWGTVGALGCLLQAVGLISRRPLLIFTSSVILVMLLGLTAVLFWKATPSLPGGATYSLELVIQLLVASTAGKATPNTFQMLIGLLTLRKNRS